MKKLSGELHGLEILKKIKKNLGIIVRNIPT